MYAGHVVVKAYSGEGDAIRRFERYNADLYDSGWKSQFLSGLMMPLMNLVGNLGYVVVCVVGAARAMDGTISFGVIVAFMMYIRLFTQPLAQFAQAFQNLQRCAAASERGKLSRDAVMMAVKSVVIDRMSMARVAANLGVAWHTANDAVLAAGAELLVSDIDHGKVQLAMEQLGAHPIANDALLSTPCDILAPCGLGAVFNRQSVGQLRCAAVAGSASAQLTNLQVADQLEGRGILYAPDYVINSGGLIYVALKHRGADPHSITAHLARIPARLTEIYAHAQADHQSPARIADRLAERILYGPQ
jgi:hypothetical protein